MRTLIKSIRGFSMLYFILLLGCVERPDFENDRQLETKFNNALKNAIKVDSVTFRLDTMTTFKWNKVYIFGDYTHGKEVVELTKNSIFKDVELGEFSNLFVFMQDGKVISYFRLPTFSNEDGEERISFRFNNANYNFKKNFYPKTVLKFVNRKHKSGSNKCFLEIVSP